MRILHVVESYAAGTQSAVHSYVSALPDHEHHLLRGHRDGEENTSSMYAEFSSVRRLRNGARGVADISRTIRDLSPDIVHLHSSKAGAMGRIARRGSTRLAYTPHCFAFERQDLPRPVRLALKTIERVLSYRTDVTVACSTREAALAASLRPRHRVVYVPNVSLLPPPTKGEPAPASPYVVALGRLSPQKRPELYAHVAQLVKRSTDVRFVWIGDGTSRAHMESHGVEVTGWIPAEHVADLVAGSAALVHTAAWEGFPLALLEADKADTAIVAAAFPALADAPTEWISNEPAELASHVQRLIDDPAQHSRNRAAWARYLALNTPSHQRAALLTAYGVKDQS